MIGGVRIRSPANWTISQNKPPMRLELITCRLRDGCSSHLSYGGISERRESNPLYPVWKTGALPLAHRSQIAATRIDETRIVSRCSSISIRRKKSEWQESNLRPHGPKPCALRRLSYTLKKLREWDSNPRISRLTGERLATWPSLKVTEK